jgi:small-conductance mechanosensitive channel/CRP-like cAMP-binding protein
MVILGLNMTSWLLLLGAVVFSAVWFYLYKASKRKDLHLSLLLIIIFLALRFILSFSSGPSNIALYLHVTSLLIISLAIIKIFIKVFLEEFLDKRQHINVPKIVQDLLQIGAFVLVAIIILKEYFKLDTSILVTSSVISIVIGLALQDTLGNFFSGLAIQMQRPFEEGDWIEINGNLGQVNEIDWRAIRIITLNNDYYIIPNSEIAKSSFINYSKPTTLHRIVIPMGIHYQTPPNFAKKVIMDILKEETEILAYPKPSILLVKYNDFSIDYEIRVYTNNFHRFKEITDSIYTKIWYQFKRNNIIIPFPIRDVYMHEVKLEDESGRIQNICNLLKTVDFLTPLTEEELNSLARGVKLENYASKEVIIKQGEPGDSFYIIENGEAAVRFTDDKGEISTIKTLTSSTFFGELSLLTGSNRTATVIAITDCQLIKINTDTFKSIIMSNPAVTEKISHIITSRQIELDRNMRERDVDSLYNEIDERSTNLLSRMKNFFGL